MLQPLVWSNTYLCGEAITVGVNRRTDYGRKSGIDQRLPAHHDKRTMPLGIARRIVKLVEFASTHIPLFFRRRVNGCLVPKHIHCLSIQSICVRIDNFDVSRVQGLSRFFLQVVTKYFFDKCRARSLGAHLPINFEKYVW